MNRYPEIRPFDIMETGGEVHRSIDESISILSAMVNYDGMEESSGNLAGLRGLVDKLRDTEQRIRKQLDAYDGASKVIVTVPQERVSKCKTILTLLGSIVSQPPHPTITQPEVGGLLTALAHAIPNMKDTLRAYGYAKDDRPTTTVRPLEAADTCHAHITSLRAAIGGPDDTPDTRAVISSLMDVVELDMRTLKASLHKFGLIKKKE